MYSRAPWYESNKDQFKVDRRQKDQQKMDELKSRLFANQSCFLINMDSEDWEKYRDDDLIPENFTPRKEQAETDDESFDSYFDQNDFDKNSNIYTFDDVPSKLIPQSRKVIDFVEASRTRAIDEVKKAEEETLRFYEVNKREIRMKREEESDEEKAERVKSQIFAKKHCF